MKPQLSQDYNVDSRYRGMSRAEDNEVAKQFVDRFIQKRREQSEPNMKSERAQEDRFVVDGNTTFRNLFRPSK